jgi:hypothetical protein
LPARWKRFADEMDLDELEVRGHFAPNRNRVEEVLLGRRLGGGHPDHLLATIAFSGERTDDWTPVSAALPPRDDPWFLAYVAALGAWPEQPDARLLDWARLRPELGWSDVLPVTFSEVAGSGPIDLLERLRAPDPTPATRSTIFLSVAAAARHESIAGGESRIPVARPDAPFIGPNIVVVYEADSLQDLCLLWALRAAQGLPNGLPLGVPDSQDVVAALGHFEREHAGQSFGLGGDRRWALTSLSVPIGRLREIAAANAERWRAVKVEEILQPPARAGRESTAFATFVDGEARVDAWSQEDRRLVGSRPRGMPDFGPAVNLRLENRLLPRSVSLAGRVPYDGFYYDGGWQLLARRRGSSTQHMRWPSGWTVIRALARDRGLEATPSSAGAAAATFLQQVRGNIRPLLLPELVATLHELAERRGMSWFRGRARDLATAVASAEDGDKLERIDHGLQALSLRPFEEEGNDLTFGSLRGLLGTRERANAWLEWALDAAILVQGFGTSCQHCGARAWRSTHEITPPIVCRGCGTTIGRPFPTDQLEFRYRASEALLRLVDHDAFSHVLAFRWWREYFSNAFGISRLYGAYPGVEFKRRGESDALGEADVLLVFTDGSLVAGECKRSPAGLNVTELDKLDRLSAALGSTWDFVATLAPGRECGQAWEELALRTDASSPRLVLTGDQLFDTHIMRGLNDDEFAWRCDETERATDRAERWKQQLTMFVAYLGAEHDPDSELFLDV